MKAPVAIVGGGIAGLSAAAALRRSSIPFKLYEGGSKLGGLAASYRDPEGYAHDFGAHFITNRLAAAVGIGASCYNVRRYGESVVVGRRRVADPFGLMTVPAYAASALAGRMRGKGVAPKSAADFFRARYGEALAREIAEPIVEAWSGVPATELAPSVGEGMPSSILRTIALKTIDRFGLSRAATAIGYCSSQPESPYVWHVYPKRGVDTVCRALARDVGDAIALESRVETIYVENERVVGLRVNGRDVDASAVVTSAPLPIVASQIVGSTQLEAARDLRFRGMILVNLFLRGRGLLGDVVLWTPTPAHPIFRLTEAPVAMPSLAPDGRTIITVDIGAAVDDAWWSLDEDALAARALATLEHVVPDAAARHLGHRVLRTPIGYPVYHRAYEPTRQRFAERLPIAGLANVGRNGEFRHLLMEDIYWRTIAKMREVVRAWHDASNVRTARTIDAVTDDAPPRGIAAAT